MLIRRIARPMLATTFITRGVEALRSPKPAADAARPTLEGLAKLPDPVGPNVPTNAETVAKVTAGVQIGAGLLLATGRLPRLASAALAISVVPGSLGAHAFWNEDDAERKAVERRALLTDVGLIGGLIIASVDTEGRPSLGWRGRRAARKVSERVSGVLPSTPDAPNALIDSELVDRVGGGLHVGAERGRDLAHVALERGAVLAGVGVERGTEFAEVARERAPQIAKKARKRAEEIAALTQDRSAEFAELAQKHSTHLVDVARDRAPELANAARDRRDELAAASRAQANRARKDVKRAQKELEKRTR
ncbi:DoxX family membrane protein [Mycobacterium antarcticum]|uniref:DoxX family membrane protein n=1 Tax=unclassified Mycolicibacterium TaxID=2636767 RepID=UPI0024E0D2F4|nr:MULTISPECIES: DoxX family membrane protein [unclassified Mycolicibacterium]